MIVADNVNVDPNIKASGLLCLIMHQLISSFTASSLLLASNHQFLLWLKHELHQVETGRFSSYYRCLGSNQLAVSMATELLVTLRDSGLHVTL